MHQRQHARRDERGSALAISLIVVLTVASLGAALIQLHASLTRRQIQGVDEGRALYLAEAGLCEAYLALAQGKSGNVGTPELPARYGDGIYWVAAEEDDGGRVALHSTGLCGSGRFSISLVLEREENAIGDLGVFADRHVILGEGTIVDGYDSREGAFDEQATETVGREAVTGGGAKINANRDIIIESAEGGLLDPLLQPPPTIVYGDATPGPQGAVRLEPGVTVTGSTTPRQDYARLPGIAVPEIESSGSLLVGERTEHRVLAGDRHLDDLEVLGGSKLTLRGPANVVVGSLILRSSSELEIDSSEGPVVLYVNEYMRLGLNSRLSSVTRDPLGSAIMVGPLQRMDHDGDGQEDPPIRISCDGEFFGLIYVPYNSLALPSTLRLYGSVVAAQLDVAPGSRITTDAALSDSGIGTETIPRQISWRVAELPDEQIVKIRIDPLKLLGLQGVTPVPTQNAHLEQTLHLKYLDSILILRTYDGDPDLVNWADVYSIVSVAWS